MRFISTRPSDESGVFSHGFDKDILSKAEYLRFDTTIYHDRYYSLYDFKLLDKDGNDLGVSSEDIEGDDIPIDCELDNDLGRYFWEYDETFELKLNY